MRRFLFLLPLLLAACGSQHFHVAPGAPPRNAARYLDLSAGAQVATLHFPAGTYVFYAQDKAGFYYRAPQKIVEHGSVPHEGGIFVSKRHARKLRGYVYRYGALTHVGNLSSARYSFHD